FSPLTFIVNLFDQLFVPIHRLFIAFIELVDQMAFYPMILGALSAPVIVIYYILFFVFMYYLQVKKSRQAFYNGIFIFFFLILFYLLFVVIHRLFIAFIELFDQMAFYPMILGALSAPVIVIYYILFFAFMYYLQVKKSRHAFYNGILISVFLVLLAIRPYFSP